MPADDSARSRWWRDPAARAAMRAAAAAVPVVLVNSTAFIGQFAYLRQHVPWAVPGVVLVAVTFESVAIYLAWQAHLATMANDSATRLKLGAYSFALVMGAMNYSHYAATKWQPTVMAVGMGFMSALSPWLWGVHTRRASRDKLMALGLIEQHAVRLGATRWTWHAYRSARVMWRATWVGENDPKRAINHFAGKWGEYVEPAVPSVPSTLLRAVPEQPSLALPERSTVPAAVPSLPDYGGAPPFSDVPRLSRVQPFPRQDRDDEPDQYHDAGVIPGTELNGEPVAAVHQGEAFLEAHGGVSGGGKPSQGKIDEVQEWLDGLILDEVKDSRTCSIREVARRLGDPNQRRLAKRMRDARLADLEQRAQVRTLPVPGANHAGRTSRLGPQLIATPSAFQPGGAN